MKHIINDTQQHKKRFCFANNPSYINFYTNINLDMNMVLKKNIISRRVSQFPGKHSNGMFTLLLSSDKKSVFSGCYNSQLMRHSLHTLKSIQGIVKLDIGEISGIDIRGNLVVVGGKYKFCLLRLNGKCRNDLYLINDIYLDIVHCYFLQHSSII